MINKFKKVFNFFIIFIFLFTCNVTLFAAPLVAVKESEIAEIEKAQTTLLLHFDVNKTLIAVDPASSQTLEQILNALLADKFKYKWSSEIQEPISYQEYVESYLLPGPAYDQELKKKRRALISHFVNFVQETHHPLQSEIVEEYTFLNEKLQDKYIFFSFFNLFEELKAQNIQFRIILRTFGNDLDPVISAITQTFPEEKFSGKGYFSEGKLHIHSDHSSFVFDNLQDVYIFFKSNSHIAIQDNWQEWNDHQESKDYAKRFPIDLEDNQILSLFFDDNIKERQSPDNIVTPINIKTGECLDIEELIEQKKIFRVNTYQAIVDDHYFMDLVNQSLEASGKKFRILF